MKHWWNAQHSQMRTFTREIRKQFESIILNECKLHSLASRFPSASSCFWLRTSENIRIHEAQSFYVQVVTKIVPMKSSSTVLTFDVTFLSFYFPTMCLNDFSCLRIKIFMEMNKMSSCSEGNLVNATDRDIYE